ncbi:MAG: alpha/beta hydrolase [Proteobacteria bacterium]|nr:alpha/beta hydrolase [Pseudomonadota bacterium]
MTIREGFAPANELSLHYAESGSPDVPLIVFLHGFPEFWRCWTRQLEDLSDRFHCIAPDLPGYNLSTAPQDVARYRSKWLVEDLDAFAANFSRGKPFTLVAHDWGGALAWAYAIKKPERLSRLIIVNATHPGTFAREIARNPAQAGASQYIREIREPGSEARFAADDYALLWRSLAPVMEAGHLTADDKKAYLKAWSQPGALTGMFNWYRAMRLAPAKTGEASATDTIYDPEALKVRVPTLVIWGEQDKALLPGCLDGLEDFVPGVKIIRVSDGSHWVVHEKPELVTRAIREFSGSIR